MACCEYDKKNDEISNVLSIALLIFLSFVLFSGMIIFIPLGFFSEKAETFADFCYYGIKSLSSAPDLFLNKWKMKLSSSFFSFSPYLAGLIFKKLPVIFIVIINILFYITLYFMVKFV